MSMLFKTEKIL